MKAARAAWLWATVLVSCGPSAGVVHTGSDGGDAGSSDAGAVDSGFVDAGEVDAGPLDAGPIDAGPTDAGVPDAGEVDAGEVDAGPPDAGPVDAGPTFYPVKEPDELTNVNGLFTTGGQYVDPGNGVLQDSWSMLVRWQGSSFTSSAVSYDLGTFTGLHPPAPASDWQRGPQPEDPGAGSPGVQLYGYEAGLLISTWQIPHQYIEGGGYNDMYGYAWSAPNRPLAFASDSDLVLQSDLAVPTFTSAALVNGVWTAAQPGSTGDYADGQLGLFAYLEDTSHPSLHPIALVFLALGQPVQRMQRGGQVRAIRIRRRLSAPGVVSKRWAKSSVAVAAGFLPVRWDPRRGSPAARVRAASSASTIRAACGSAPRASAPPTSAPWFTAPPRSRRHSPRRSSSAFTSRPRTGWR